jgi:GT2 family glycosyltransferase
MKKLSVITINYNTPETTIKALDIFKANNQGLDYEIILIDNGSEKKVSASAVQALGGKFIVNKNNLGFAGAANQGIKIASGEYILLLNSDAFLKKEAVDLMLKYADTSEQAIIIGPKFYYPDGREQISAGFFPNFWREFFRLTALYKIFPYGIFLNRHLDKTQEVDWLSGGCLLFKKEIIKAIGLLDEKYFFGYEDIDFCRRAKKQGVKIIYYPKAEVIHYHGLSSGGVKAIKRREMEKASLAYFLKKNLPEKKVIAKLIIATHGVKISLLKLFMKKYIPQDATIAATYQCNSHCRMCNIWQIKNPADLPLEAFYNLSSDLKYINLSGGEVFLRHDLPEIIKIIKKTSPRAQIIISSNGLATDLIIKRMKEIIKLDKKIGIRISLDGIGKIHDEVRGVKGIYGQVIKTIELLKNMGVKNLGLSFTIMDFNIGELNKVYELSRELKVELALALVQNSSIYFQKNDNKAESIKEIERELSALIKNELKSWNIKRWLRAYYNYGLLVYAKHQKRLLPSGAGFDSLFIDPSGDVFPSNLINIKMGNIKEEKLNKLWNDDNVRQARHYMQENNISESWIICTIRGEIKKHWLKVGWWILKNKLNKKSLL